MGNKKNIIGLSILFLVFLLSLSTTAYADVYREFDYTDLKNFLYNGLISRGNTIEASEAYVASLTDLQYREVAEALNTYDYCIVAYGYSCLEIRAGNTNYTSGTNLCTYLRNDGSQIINNTMTYTYGVEMYFAGNRSGQVIEARYGTININYIPQNLFYSSYDIFNGNYNGASSGTAPKIGEPPIYKNTSGFFSGIYQPEPDDPEMTFTPISPIGAEAIRVEDNVGIDCIGVEKNSTYKSMKFGDLYVPSYYYITNINVLWWYYNRGTDRWLYKYILQEDGDDITPSSYRSSIVNFKWEDSYKENETTIIHYSVWINRDFVINDTIYQIAVIGTKFKDGSPKYVGANYFIKSSYTTIVNGILDTDYIKNTPYGDEYNNIVGDIADKVDDLDDLTNSITAGIGNGLIGASGDWYPLNSLASGDDILGTAQMWGFRNYTNLYWQGIYQLLTNTFTVLGQTGSVDLDVSFHGYQKVISSDDIVSPPAAIKDFISLCMVTFTMIAIYKHFNKKIENIQAADTSKIKNEADDSNLM